MNREESTPTLLDAIGQLDIRPLTMVNVRRLKNAMARWVSSTWLMVKVLGEILHCRLLLILAVLAAALLINTIAFFFSQSLEYSQVLAFNSAALILVCLVIFILKKARASSTD